MKTEKTRAALTISMPQGMAEELGKNRSALFREEFRELQTYGAELAQQKGVFTESDVEKFVFEGR